MISMLNNEIIFLKQRSEKIEYDLITEFYNYLKTHVTNNDAYIEYNDKKIYMSRKVNVDSNYINSLTEVRDASFFTDEIKKYFNNGLNNQSINLLYLNLDYGNFGKPTKIINVNDVTNSIDYDQNNAITNDYNVLFTLITSGEECKLFCQYTKDGNNSPLYIVYNLITKFKEIMKSEDTPKYFTSKVESIIPGNIIEEFFGKGSYDTLTVSKYLKDVAIDELDYSGFGVKRVEKAKKIGYFQKKLNIDSIKKNKIVNFLNGNKISDALECLGIDYKYFDEASVEINANGRTKTFKLQRLSKENISKEINLKNLEKDDGSLDKKVLLSEYLIELKEVLENRLKI